MLASFAGMLGADVPACDSVNLYGALTGADGFGRNEIYAEGTRKSKVLRQGKWLFIEPDDGVPLQRATNTETANSRDPQLYNLDYDIGQQRNLAYRYPKIVRDMAARIEEIKQGNVTEKAEEFRLF